MSFLFLDFVHSFSGFVLEFLCELFFFFDIILKNLYYATITSFFEVPLLFLCLFFESFLFCFQYGVLGFVLILLFLSLCFTLLFILFSFFFFSFVWFALALFCTGRDFYYFFHCMLFLIILRILSFLLFDWRNMREFEC